MLRGANTLCVGTFLTFLLIAWKPVVSVLNHIFLHQAQEFTSLALQEKHRFSWNPISLEDLGCSWVSATVRKQAEGMWKCEAIWLLVHFHTGSRGHWEPSKGCWDPAPTGNIWSHPSSARTCVLRYVDCLQTGWWEKIWTGELEGELSKFQVPRALINITFHYKSIFFSLSVFHWKLRTVSIRGNLLNVRCTTMNKWYTVPAFQGPW